MMLETLLLMASALPTQDFKPDDVRAVAVAIADEIDDDPREAATLLETAYEESRFKPNAIGDHGAAFGVYQLHRVPMYVGFDLHLATPIARDRLRSSAELCPGAPLAPYIGGCHNRTARRVSAHRLAIVERLVRRASDSPKSSLRERLFSHALAAVLGGQGGRLPSRSRYPFARLRLEGRDERRQGSSS
jgi:hypothetical protein